MTEFAVVVPTIGRPVLARMLASLQASEGPRPRRVVVVDDRPPSPEPLPLPRGGWLEPVIRVLHSCGRGPAAARNLGWRAVDTSWVAFVDDDVVLPQTWLANLAADLESAELDSGVVGSQARIVVPLPADRRPTDWERNTAGLADAAWITADMAYRRDALRAVAGFDERFPRAYREDADLALRVLATGRRLIRGSRVTTHPVRPAPWRASITAQRGNADDALMARLHGRSWHAAAAAAPGRWRANVLTTAVLGTGLLTAAAKQRRSTAAALAAWAALTAHFTWLRVAPGPHTGQEVATMAVTSVAIPPLAVWHRLRGAVRHRRAGAWPAAIEAVLFDRDGTLVHDVAYNGNPALVRPVPGARQALDRLRQRGVRIGMVTNQSGVARGLLTEADVKDVNAKVAELLGPFDSVQVCVHDDSDDCACRKPRPGMMLAAAAELGVPIASCAVIGDTAADIVAGSAAGAGMTILVPNEATRREEVATAPTHATDLAAAVAAVLGRVAR